MAMSSSSRPSPSLPHQPPPTQALDLEVTIVSGKHLKNVNWKNGDLKPYAIFWVDPDNKLTTKSDDSGSTKPVWNQRFFLPIITPLSDSCFNLEIFHSKASESPKPFVGSLQVRLTDVLEQSNPTLSRTYDLLRPSGRPQGKIRLKLAVKERPIPSHPVPNYQNAPPTSFYYSSAPPYPNYAPNNTRSAPSQVPPTTAAYPYSMGYYSSGHYPPPPLPRTFSDRFSTPSAPVEYSQARSGGGGFGLGTGVAVGAVAGVLGGMALDEGLKYEDGKIMEKVEDNLAAGDDLSDYHY